MVIMGAVMGSAIATPYAVMAYSAVGNEGPSLAACGQRPQPSSFSAGQPPYSGSTGGGEPVRPGARPDDRSETERHWDQVHLTLITIGAAALAAAFLITGLGTGRDPSEPGR